MTKSIRTQSIGIFDSGLGGLSIFREIARILPEYDFVYLGDTARVPYGTRSSETVYAFTEQAVRWLFKNECGLVILACNTASSDALRILQEEYVPAYFPGRNVLGVLIPAAEEAVSATRNGTIGIMATPGTVLSQAFVREIRKMNPEARVSQSACPLLVPLVEAGENDSPPTEYFLKKYMAPLLAQHIDTLILGCTHYGILESRVKKLAGESVTVISEGPIVAEKLSRYLEKHPDRERTLGKNRKRLFYSTDMPEYFEEIGGRFFGGNITVQRATLSERLQ